MVNSVKNSKPLKELTETDISIIRELQKDPRSSFRRIAKSLGLAVLTVSNHVHQLERSNIIKGYAVELDYEVLGYNFHVIIDVKVQHGKLFFVEKKISEENNVHTVLDHTGMTDVTVIARFKDRKGLDQFVKKIQSFPLVERTETKLILNVMKQSQTLL